MQLGKLQRQVSAQLRSTPLLEHIARGTANRGQYRTYLTDAWFYTRHSAHIVAHAGIRLANRQPRLSRYMAHRAARRLGHQSAVQADLSALGVSEESLPNLRPSSPCLRMIALQYFYAKEDNPVGVLGWMFVLQSLGGQVGGNVAEALDQSLELRGTGTRFLALHGRTTRGDLVRLCQFLEASTFDAIDGECFVRSVNEAADLYCGMLDVAFATSESTLEKPSPVIDLQRLLH